ncbi:DUF2290 domain-containing protein [Psychroserpens sp. SPM9]|uniref:DUF2290 domain-containing protein n=1 Tax=Psychroserpens sp. SPM9 TaxID=2975598 RepID=UPI0021A518ED|nr:DUF2290 domain-containing protein [Psychroserpens sp. SPM9]MDG5493235.1 DUF2290 domain-containing protein [Psychroserpens sp. SPM9]
MTKNEILDQINVITSSLIEVNLSEEQNFPSEKNGSIYISGNHDISISLKNIPYSDIYSILREEKNYNVKLVDGALIQILYSFDNEDSLKKYRLAFFPSPDLDEFQNNSEIYELDEIYADIIQKNIITTPIRFDFDPGNHKIIDHPCSHLTIGQYKNCRIPLYKPITPFIFIDFILRNFYNTAKNKFSEVLKFNNTNTFDYCIHELEKKILHLSIV